MNNKTILIILIGFTSFFALATIVYVAKNPINFQRLKSKIARLSKPVSKNIGSKSLNNIIKPSYSDHVKSGEKHSILLETNQNIREEQRKGKLIKVKNNTGYKVAKLNHSKDVLVQPGYLILQEIGKRFHTKTDGKYFTVTSLTRSVENQKRLTKFNHNATKNISSHSYGVSFDISYVRFNGVRGPNIALKKILWDILNDLENEKKIYVIHEKSQSCFHVTVR